MAAFALTDVFMHVHGYDLTCDSNELRMELASNPLDVTTFCSDGWTELIGGVKSSTFNMAGFWSQGQDVVSFDDLGVVNRAMTFGPVNTEGQVAYLAKLGHFNYQQGGAHGEAAPFALTAAGSDGWGVVRGKLAAAKQTVTATGVAGSVVELGAVAADEYLYATFHVFEAGTTITVQVQSDENATFAAPTTRATIGPLTTTGGTFIARVAGAITDTHYRLNVSAITGEFSVAGAIGVG